MAVKIKLKRLGSIRNPQYRVVIADARTARNGRSIEEIGIYHPKHDPSVIQIDSDRAQYWLGVGAQPTEPVLTLLKITGDWQKFKGLPGAEGTLKVAEPKETKQAKFAATVTAVANEPRTPTIRPVVAKVVEEVKEVVEEVKEAAEDVVEAIVDAATEAVDTIAEVVEEIKEAVSGDESAAEEKTEEA